MRARLLFQRLFRFRPKSGVDSAARVIFIRSEPLEFPTVGPECVPDRWDVLHGPKPLFLNKMYRMRPKQPAEDPDTITHAIRAKQLPVDDPEPVHRTLPATQAASVPSFLDRPYRMRPKSGKASLPAANPIPCAAIDPKGAFGAPASALHSVSRHWKVPPLRIKALAATVPILLLLAFFPVGKAAAAAATPIHDAIVRRTTAAFSIGTISSAACRNGPARNGGN